MNNEELKSVALTGGIPALNDLGKVYAFSELLVRTNMVPKGVNTEQAVVAIIAGASLGLNPFQAVQGIASINGRPALWGDALLAVVKASGLVENETVEWYPNHSNATGVRVTVKRKGVDAPYVGEFSKAMAERAGLWDKTGPWKSYPDRMMLSRARAFAYRDGFADILKGMKSAEEERDVVDAVVVEQPRKTRRAISEVFHVEHPKEQPKEIEQPVETVEVKQEDAPKADALNALFK